MRGERCTVVNDAALIVRCIPIWILIKLLQRISSGEQGNAPVLPPCVTVRGFQLSLNHSSKWLCLVVGESLKAVLMVAVAVSDAAVT